MNNLLSKSFFQRICPCESSRIFQKLLFWFALSFFLIPSNGFAQEECHAINVKI